METAVEARGLSKNYGSVRALASVDLSIARGEYFVLLGPSGGGKTTLLRLIAGFLRPTKGSVIINGKDVSGLPPNKRPTSMVFQSFALFPHMSVAQNVGYGLKLRKLPPNDIAYRVDAMLDVVDLSGYGERRVWELSGGQQQRVQLARSLVLEPDILLLDEPLAALDAKLRKDMCFWLKQLQERVEMTFIHVTHNQEEAMSVADRLAIISSGDLVEAGTAQALYEAPRRRFTADFIGENNIFDGTVVRGGPGGTPDAMELDIGFAKVPLAPNGTPIFPGEDVSVSVRSERMRLVKEPMEGQTNLQVTYVEAFYLGLVTRHQIKLPDGNEISIRTISDGSAAPVLARGEEAFVTWAMGDSRLHVD